MTDLKELLDDAAGPESGVTDSDLAADLDRGRSALRRRRITGIAAGAVSTALVIAVGWSVLPSALTDNSEPAPATHTTKPPVSKTPTIPESVRRDKDKRKPPVIPATAVPLVANTKPFPGVITCDLIPEGWSARITYAAAGSQQQELYDPKLGNANKLHAATYTVTIRQTELIDMGEGPTVDKYSTAWTKLPKVRAGRLEAVTSGVPGSPYGRQQVFVKPDKSSKIVGVSNNAYNLAWDMNTLLKFAGSCHYK
jgi:hypothetical protein